jgi:D-alanine-D-alanine ligase
MSGKLKVAVLMGGSSAERNVSLSTGRQILNALDSARYSVYALDTGSGEVSLPSGALGNARVLTFEEASTGANKLTIEGSGESVTELTELGRLPTAGRPDVVFIALHGPGGEDGTVQGMLELLGVPYTGSGVLASALAMDKTMSKRVLTSAGVLMPRDVVARRGHPTPDVSGIPMPLIVKPSRQGSTFGVTVVNSVEELNQALDTAFQYDDTALIEQMISGTEITVPIIGNENLEVLPIVEIVPAKGFYDYEAKYTPGATEEIVPARISDVLSAKAREIATTCHRTLGCRGMSRTDMIVSPAGEIYTLEVNTIPGMTPTSLLPRSAEAAGITFPRLLDKLIELALD